MKIHLVTFSNKSWYDDTDYYGPSLKRLTESALNNGVNEVHSYNEENLPVSEDILNYMLENRRSGFGFYSWKPIVILDTLQKLPEGDVVLYHDVGRPNYNYEIKKDVNPLIRTIVNEYNGVGVVAGEWLHRNWCKRHCFQAMGCDYEEYWGINQLTANWNIWQKNSIVLEIVNLWKNWCLTPSVVDTKSFVDTNIELDNFSEHRWDQAILTNIIRKYELNNIGIKPLPLLSRVWEKNINNWL
jgi:hypothetical protein